MEGTVGWAGFVDDATIHHTRLRRRRAYLPHPRISVGPEFAYMVGPDADRDIFVLGSMWIDLLAPAAGRPVVPYVVFGGGFMSHRDELGRGPYPWKYEGSFTAGGGSGCGSAIASTSAATSGSAGSCTCAATRTSGVTWPGR